MGLSKGEAFSYASLAFLHNVSSNGRALLFYVQRHSSDQADDANSSMRCIHFLDVMARDQRVR